MGRFDRGLTLAQGSLRILWGDKRLLVFALLSGLCTLGTGAAILLPSMRGVSDGGTGIVSLPLLPLFGFYIATSFITLFFNTALVALVLARLQGSRLSIGEGLWIAFDNTPSIAVLAVLSALFGLLMRTIGRRFRFAGEITALLVGAAWTVATFVVLPVMIVEQRGPFASIGRSAALVRKTWGERASGSLGIGLAGFVVSIPGIAVLVKGLTLTDAAARTACIGGAVVYFALIWLIVSTLDQILRAAVYLYADTGVLHTGLDQETIDGALRPE